MEEVIEVSNFTCGLPIILKINKLEEKKKGVKEVEGWKRRRENSNTSFIQSKSIKFSFFSFEVLIYFNNF